jgi:predicted SAM-dependent methyltransferase
MSGKYGPQVDAKTYVSKKYITPARWTSYSVVIKEILKMEPQTILEIGPGNKIVFKILSSMGFTVNTMDIDERIDPDYVCDITSDNIKKMEKSFDLVLAEEVLEHIRYEDALSALKNLRHITDKLIITLPHTNMGAAFWYIAWKIPMFKKSDYSTKVFFRRKKHVFNGQHYWEIGKRGYSLNKVLKDMTGSGWKVDSTYINPDNTYHRVFMLSKV